MLITGDHQEGWRPAIAFNPHRIEPRLGVSEVPVPVGRHRSAGVDVRVNQRAERFDALKRRIKVKPQFAGHAQIGSLSRSDDDPISRANRAFPVVCGTAEDDRSLGCAHRCHGKAGHEGHSAGVNHSFERNPQLTPRPQLIRRSAPEGPRQIGAPRDPDDGCARQLR